MDVPNLSTPDLKAMCKCRGIKHNSFDDKEKLGLQLLKQAMKLNRA